MKQFWKVTLAVFLIMISVMTGNCSFAVGTDYNIVFTWDTTNQLEKSISYNTNSEMVIDWGDGTTSTYEAASEDTTCVHTYTSSGNYTVGIVCSDISYIRMTQSQLSSVDFTNATTLQRISIWSNNVRSLDVTENTELIELVCNNNPIKELDLSKNTKLGTLACNNMELTELDVSNLSALNYLKCGNNGIVSLDLTNNSALTKVCITQETLENVYVTEAQIKNLTITNETAGCTGYVNGENVFHKYPTTKMVVSNLINWIWDTTDQLTKSVTLKTNGATTIYWGDGSTSSVDASSSQLTLSHTYTSAGDYTCMISDDVLTYLDCSNNKLSSIDVSGCTSLNDLYCNNNELSSINVSGCTSLNILICNNNNLSSMDLSGCTSVSYLICNDNNLSSIDLSGCTLLGTLNCISNNLSSIDLSNCTSLSTLYCGDNQLTTLDVTANTSLYKLCCVQSTLNVLKLTQQQAGGFINILDEATACDFTSSGEFHKFANTQISVLCTEHTGGTHSNGGTCAKCGEVYQTHGQSATVSSYTTTATQHTPIYACSYSGCTSTYLGTLEVHTGGTVANNGTCTVCGVKYIEGGNTNQYYLKLDNGLVRTILTVFPGELVRVGFIDGENAIFTVNSGNVALTVDGNYRTFTMPSETVDITISKQ